MFEILDNVSQIFEKCRAQSFQVQLPNDFTCLNCTLRLIRQAIEWGTDYKFWSCADVDIKTSKFAAMVLVFFYKETYRKRI
jgi:hypothetical protein